MARCYSDAVSKRHPPFPRIWLVSDRRNDTGLEAAIARLPRRSGLIFRHYHLHSDRRRARFAELRRAARRRGHLLYLSADPRTARRWGADGVYGPPDRLARGPGIPRLVTVHTLRELRRAGRAMAVAVSPIFTTRSHPGARPLGITGFRAIARHALVPAIALGGMTERRARALGIARWAAIDGLSATKKHRIPKDS
jgi:thiamine-phosphate pyrophosphorylase